MSTRLKSSKQVAMARAKSIPSRLAAKGNFDIVNYASNGSSPIQWSAAQLNPDNALRFSLRNNIDKSRALEVANPYAEAFLHEHEANVLSSAGMTLQMQVKYERDETLPNGVEVMAGQFDTYANMAIGDTWYDFWHKKGHCDVSGRYAGLDAERVILRSIMRDGSVLIRLVRGFDNAFGFAIQIMEVDVLDFNHNEILPNGNEIRMSVEVDTWGRAVAYWIRPYRPGDWQFTHSGGYTRGDKIRVPAEGFQTKNDDPSRGTILCPFVSKRAGQTLGWPWMTPVLDTLNSLTKAMEAEVVSTRAEAEKQMIIQQAAEAGEYTGERDANGNLVIESVPGATHVLPPGYTVASYNPTHPNGNMGELRKIMMREFGSGLGMAYGTIANDRSDSSFSAERTAVRAEQEIYKLVQRFFGDHVLCPIFSPFLEMQLLKKKINLPIEKFDKFNKPYFQGRRWGLLNPVQDVQAYERLRDRGWISDMEITGELGRHLEDVYNEIELGNEMAQDRGPGKPALVFGDPKQIQAQQSQQQQPDQPFFPQKSLKYRGQPRQQHGQFGTGKLTNRKLSDRAKRAKGAHHMVDKTIQRYAEEHNEPRLAKALGGISFPDSEPIDIAVPGPDGRVAHGLELKTIVSNKAGKITMKKDAMARKAAWEHKNKATVHTVVVDDSKVFNALGEGKHDESKRVIYYRRGYGSFRINSMHKVGSVEELKTLLNTPKHKLPEAAR